MIDSRKRRRLELCNGCVCTSTPATFQFPPLATVFLCGLFVLSLSSVALQFLLVCFMFTLASKCEISTREAAKSCHCVCRNRRVQFKRPSLFFRLRNSPAVHASRYTTRRRRRSGATSNCDVVHADDATCAS